MNLIDFVKFKWGGKMYIIDEVTDELLDLLDEDRTEYEIDPISGKVTLECDHIYYDHLCNLFDLN